MTDLDLAGKRVLIRLGEPARCPIGSACAGERPAMDGRAGRSEAREGTPWTATASQRKRNDTCLFRE
jgi:hypothetical protein